MGPTVWIDNTIGFTGESYGSEPAKYQQKTECFGMVWTVLIYNSKW